MKYQQQWKRKQKTTRSFKKKRPSKIIITKTSKIVFLFRFKSQMNKQQQNVRKTYSFSNIKTLLDMLGMQDFALNISKYMFQKPLKIWASTY